MRVDPQLYLKAETAIKIRQLQDQGFTVFGKGADTYDCMTWQFACGIVATYGTVTPVKVDEETVIRDQLAER